ncbi:transposable element Tcb2 transposase [Trichonephila clavipes]|uniref:Transposable element Tcb2 transposase n=1 Tax=Trichonephila clavipes TaxID=2585209 RepID=A0A8X6WDW7_TRICX|nr:transposable element Tcb2 transposase [Trichonephila clavipes]
MLMDNNCRPHRTNLVNDFLFKEGITRMEWPACSPDMNLIEHVWDILDRGVAPPPQTLLELERALPEIWDRILSSSLIGLFTPYLKGVQRSGRCPRKP